MAGPRQGAAGARRARRRYRAVLAAALALATAPIVASGPARGQSPAEVRELPAVFSADEVVYDRELDLVVARGRVEMVQGQRIIRADTVSYNRRANLVTASGNVSLLENTGDVVFASYMELTDDLREGIAQNFRALLADQSRLAGVSARRVDGNLTILRKVVYSACELCRDDPSRPPLWQIKAATAQHDQAARTISYRDARLEFAGVPVLYTPYLEHPDGTVRRESGFLPPVFGTNSVLGRFYGQPYFQTFGPSADATIEPYFFTDEHPLLAGEYRQRFGAGQVYLNASATYASVYNNDVGRTDNDSLQGHIAGVGRFDIDDTWRAGFEAAASSPNGYLLRYKLFERFKFIDRNTLTNRPYIEGFRGRSYASAEGFAFQGLREQDDQGQAPYVLPLLQYQYLTQPDTRGGYFRFDSYSYAIMRTKGVNDQHTAAVGGYHLPYIASTGEIWDFRATLQGDLFNTSTLGTGSDGFVPSGAGTNARVFPQASLGWRYPFARVDDGLRTIVEPVVSVVAAPILGGQNKLPNEDSQAIDFDVTNLFRPNRFTGYDRVDTGQRVNYGLQTHFQRIGTPYRGSAFVGQSYRFQNAGSFPTNTNPNSNGSDLVGRLSVTPHEWLNGNFLFTLSADDLTMTRNVASVRLGPDAINLSFAYSYIERSTQPSLAVDLEQLSTRFAVRLDENWQLIVRDIRQFGQDAGGIRFNAGLIYEDECFLFGIDFDRQFVGTLDNPADTSIIFRVALRNLGEARISGY